MKWTKVNFGSKKGMTLPQVMFKDPDWFFWAYENNAIKRLAQEAEEIYRKLWRSPKLIHICLPKLIQGSFYR